MKSSWCLSGIFLEEWTKTCRCWREAAVGSVKLGAELHWQPSCSLSVGYFTIISTLHPGFCDSRYQHCWWPSTTILWEQLLQLHPKTVVNRGPTGCGGYDALIAVVSEVRSMLACCARNEVSRALELHGQVVKGLGFQPFYLWGAKKCSTIRVTWEVISWQMSANMADAT